MRGSAHPTPLVWARRIVNLFDVAVKAPRQRSASLALVANPHLLKRKRAPSWRSRPSLALRCSYRRRLRSGGKRSG